MSRESKILTAILVGVVGVMVGLFALANRDTAPPAVGDKNKIIRDTSHKTGSGAIELVEFGDYQCPACGAAHPNVKQLLKDYDGKVTFYFRNFPLTNIHANALLSAQAAETAGAEGKFWEMHNKLFESQKEWSNLNSAEATDKFGSYAADLGLDVAKFKKALADKTFQNIIDQDLADANVLGLQSTPSFFFNGQPYTGKHDYASLRDALEAELGKAGSSTSATPAPAAPAPTTPTPAT